VKTFNAVTVLVLLAGCQQSPQPPAPQPVPTPAPAPVAQAPDQAPQNLPAAKKEEPKQDRFPLNQDQFKAGVSGNTRDQVLAKYGPPDELGEWGAAVGWDGPVSIYWGPFSAADGKKAAKARIYFRKQGKSNVVANVEFVNQ
jgi:hypothetical protein